MKNFFQQNEYFEKLLFDLKCDIVCGTMIASKIKSSFFFRVKETKCFQNNGMELYSIGEFDSKDITIDVSIKYGDLCVFDLNNNKLIDFADHGFSIDDF